MRLRLLLVLLLQRRLLLLGRRMVPKIEAQLEDLRRKIAENLKRTEDAKATADALKKNTDEAAELKKKADAAAAAAAAAAAKLKNCI